MDKNQRYRIKMMNQGRCPRCGKKSFPYRLCARHRAYLNIHRSLRKMLKHGLVVIENGEYRLTERYDSRIMYKIRKKDRRKLPRIDGHPLDHDLIIRTTKEILGAIQRPMTEREIKTFFLNRKNKNIKT